MGNSQYVSPYGAPFIEKFNYNARNYISEAQNLFSIIREFLEVYIYPSKNGDILVLMVQVLTFLVGYTWLSHVKYVFEIADSLQLLGMVTDERIKYVFHQKNHGLLTPNVASHAPR